MYNNYNRRYNNNNMYNDYGHRPHKFNIGDQLVVLSTPTHDPVTVINYGKEQYECRLPDNRAVYFYEWELDYMSKYRKNNDSLSEDMMRNVVEPDSNK